MKTSRLGRPSPALVISLVALSVALGGTGYAALKLPKNSVGTRQLKKNAVTGSKVKNGSITASDIKKGSLTGTTINVGSLGAVPIAAHASSADNSSHASSADNSSHAANADTVAGHSVITFSKLVARNTTTPQVVFSLGGLTVNLACNGTGEPDTQGVASASGSMIRGMRVMDASPPTQFGGSDVAAGDPEPLTTAADHRGGVAFQYVQADGHIVSVNMYVDDSATIGGFLGCSVSGSAISG